MFYFRIKTSVPGGAVSAFAPAPSPRFVTGPRLLATSTKSSQSLASFSLDSFSFLFLFFLLVLTHHHPTRADLQSSSDYPNSSSSRNPEYKSPTMPGPCCVVCGIPFDPIERSTPPARPWNPELDLETDIIIDRTRLGEEEIVWLYDIVAIGVRQLSQMIRHNLSEFYSVDTTEETLDLESGTIQIREDAEMDMDNVGRNYRRVGLYQEFAGMHETCFEILMRVGDQEGLPMTKGMYEDIEEDYVQYLVGGMDIDGGRGLKGFNYGVDLRKLWDNTWVDSEEFDVS